MPHDEKPTPSDGPVEGQEELFSLTEGVEDFPLQKKHPPKGKWGGSRPNTGGARPGSGRKRFQPTQEQRNTVQVLKANGNSIPVIAQVVGISEDVLRKYFSFELDSGFAHVKARVGAAVIRSALAGNVAAQKYWLVCWGGAEWRPIRAEDDLSITNGGTTVIIRGGLPPPTIDAKPNGEDKANGAEVQPPQRPDDPPPTEGT